MSGTTHPRLTPGQVRADLRARVKHTIAAASSACDVAWRGVVALTLGVTHQRIDQVCALDDDAQLSFAAACAYPEPIRDALGQMLVGEGKAIVSLPLADRVHAADDMTLVGKLQRDTSWAVSVLIDVLADGHITAAEGAKLEEACNAALAPILTARELGRRAQRERVVSIRRRA